MEVEFIKKSRILEFIVLENLLSTQIYGAYDKLMTFLTTTVKKGFESMENGLLTMKLVKSDRSDYESNF